MNVPPVAVTALPTSHRTGLRLLRAWLIALLAFGYGSALTYGWLTWLMNEEQWRWTYLMYLTEVPLLGGVGMVALPWRWFHPVRKIMQQWEANAPVERKACVAVYEHALALPGKVALAAVITTAIGYPLGTLVVYWRAHQPLSEMLKVLPAIPLVGGLMAGFCYFSTARALHPIVAWCSHRLRHVRALPHIPFGVKFLATTCLLIVATICMLQPSAYTLGQTIIEHRLKERSLEALRTTVHEALEARRPLPSADLKPAMLGVHGYAFVADASGAILTPHPQGYTQIAQEQLHELDARLGRLEEAWVDRIRRHRVIAYLHVPNTPWRVFSIALPSDFAAPLTHYIRFSWIAVLEVVFVAMLFGRYFTRSITNPLRELTGAARQIAERGEFSQHVPVTTTDELSGLASSFNRMVDELYVSKCRLEDYNRQLEESTRELSALNLELEDLLHVVSHDLKAPLINIQGFSKRLEPLMHETIDVLGRLAERGMDAETQGRVTALKASLERRVPESLGFISKGVQTMDTLLVSLLAIARVGRKADPMLPNDLNTLVDNVVATFDYQLKEQKIGVVRRPMPASLPCRYNEMLQVFSNLVSNAIRYMGSAPVKTIEIGATAHADHVECYVRDTGVGIDPEDQERIFQMFTRLNAVDAPGEGIGLAYVKKIVRSHGGRVWVSSQRGQGSTFFFTLPTTQSVSRLRGGALA